MPQLALAVSGYFNGIQLDQPMSEKKLASGETTTPISYIPPWHLFQSAEFDPSPPVGRPEISLKRRLFIRNYLDKKILERENQRQQRFLGK